MEQKVVHLQKVIAKTVRTTLKNIVAAFGDWPCKIWSDIGQSGLQVAGASVFVYTGCDENPDTEFELKMCMPVVDFDTYHGEFEKFELQEFHCVETLYVGSMPELASKGWGPFMTEIQQNKITFAQESREVYLQWVDFNSPQNQVLLQVGV